MSSSCVSSALALQKRLNDLAARVASRDRQRLYSPEDFENPEGARIDDALATIEEAERHEEER